MDELFATSAVNVFEIASLMMAAVALVYAARANRASAQAMELSKQSNLAALRMRVQDDVADAERCFHALRVQCSAVTDQWEAHTGGSYPTLSLQPRGLPEWKVPILNIEREGNKLLLQLKKITQDVSGADADELEELIKRARSTASSIDNLCLQLDTPKPPRF